MYRNFFSENSNIVSGGVGGGSAGEDVPDYDEWYDSIFNSIRDWVGSLLESLATPFEGIAQGITNLGNHFSNIFSYLNPSSDNFILKRVISFLTNIVDFINPFSENFFGKRIVDFIAELLKDMFIPKEDHFTSLHNEINSKLGFIGQVKELVYSLFPENSTYSASAPPNWTITYAGVTVSLIDWSAFEPYRGYLHSIIIFIMWASFLIRLYKRIPMIIYGYTNE